MHEDDEDEGPPIEGMRRDHGPAGCAKDAAVLVVGLLVGVMVGGWLSR